MPRLKILTLNYEFPPIGGGAAPVTLELCRQFVRLGHRTDVVTMRFRGLPAYEEIEGVRVFRTPCIRRRADLCRIHEMASYLIGAYPAVDRLLRETRYDIVHTHFIIPTGPLGLRVRRKAGCPWVITVHGSDVPGYNPDRFRVAHRLLFPYWRRLVQQADGVVSPSGSLRALLKRSCPMLDVRVIPNGIESGFFAPDAPKRPQILACSRLLPRKGIQYLIEAVRDVPLGWPVHIVGDGPYLPTLRALAEGSKTPIHFHGWLERGDSRFKELYESSAVFVFPSEAENFPTVLLEAMAAGCAVITTDAGGCSEAAGEAALYVRPRDVEGLRTQLLELIANPHLREQWSQKARARAADFSWPGIARMYLELFEGLLRKDSAGGSRQERR
ncbi:MAG TPA: glycosyltransferase family 4 protein [Anaerohalosphaeraceae bacterium]|mgnify:CR=1 FL=1|nr:glycosyltransferase family 4 protein [Anaerohalosphaeraceae bacterium]